MSAPLIYVATLRIKEGKLEGLKQYQKEVVEAFEAREPQLIAFHTFLNEDGTEMTVIQFHPDTASMDIHMKVLGQLLPEFAEKFGDVFEFIEPIHSAYYGTPSASALEMDRSLVESGVDLSLSLKPHHIGGFTRATAG